MYCKLFPVSDKLREFAKFILKLLFDWDLRNELWSQQSISKWHNFCFILEEWSGLKLLVQTVSPQSVNEKVEAISMGQCWTLYLQDENVSWPQTKRTEYFKRPILLGGEQPKIAGSVDSTESKQKENIRSNVQRQFIPTSCIVSSIPEIMGATENQHIWNCFLTSAFQIWFLWQLENPRFNFGNLSTFVFFGVCTF